MLSRRRKLLQDPRRAGYLTGLITGLWMVAMGVAAAQSGRLAFEVAAIKPNPKKVMPDPAFPGYTMIVSGRAYGGPRRLELRGISGDRFEDLAATVGDLIADAYRLKPFEIVGLPKWAAFEGGEGYDLRAKVPAGVQPTSDNVRRMLQAVLTDRFALKTHRESRTMPVYELRIMKNGTKLRPIAQAAEAKSPEKMSATKALKFSTLLAMIEQFLDRPLSDKTGLSGMFETTWNQAALEKERRTTGALGNSLAPSIFTEVKEQLGLELKAVKGPHEVLAIDSVQRPTAN